MHTQSIPMLLVSLLASCGKIEARTSSRTAEDVALAAVEAMVNLDEQAFVLLLDSCDEKDKEVYNWLFSEDSIIYEGMKNLQKSETKFAVVYRGSTWQSPSNEAPQESAFSRDSLDSASSEVGELESADGFMAVSSESLPVQNKYEDRYFDTYCFVDGKMGMLLPFKIIKKRGAWFVDNEAMKDLFNGEVGIPSNLYSDNISHRPTRLKNSPEQIFAEKSALWRREVELPDVNYGEQFTPNMYDSRCIVIDVRAVDEQGITLSSGLTCSLDELRETIWKLKRKTSKEPKIIIRADFESKHQDVAKVMNVSCSAGVWKFCIMGLEESSQTRARLANAGRRYHFKIKENPSSMDKYSLLSVNRPAPSGAMFDEEEEEGMLSTGNSAQNCARIEIGRRYDASPQGVILYNKRALGGDSIAESKTALKELDGCLEELSKVSKKAQIVIICTCDSPHKALVEVLDLCHKHGFDDLNLFTM